MKTNHHITSTAAVLAMGVLAPSLCLAKDNNANSSSNSNSPSRIPATPVGVMSAFPTVVQTGTKPTLTWDILHPSNVSDVAVINPPGTIVLEERIFVTVQPIGTNLPAAEVRLSVNGSTYQQLFYGSQSDVTPQYALYTKNHNVNTTIDLGGRSVVDNNWTTFYTTRSSNAQVVSLVNGQTPPQNLPSTLSPNLENYVKPYIDASGKVSVGPMSVLVLMELTDTNRTKPGFDYQDVVLLVTLSDKNPGKGNPNNGHGNNLDGVDVSNPGKGVGGPTGLNNSGQDPSGGYDDERR